VNYDSFFEAVQTADISLSFDNNRQSLPARLSNEALFHLPLLAITILVLSSGRRKPRVNEIGQLVGECFERVFVGFRGSSQHIGWSANLRMRTVRALSFLEVARLVTIGADRATATETGKSVVKRVFDADESDLCYTLRQVERAYRDINAERQLTLDFQ
jgi:hypothetical protein